MTRAATSLVCSVRFMMMIAATYACKSTDDDARRHEEIGLRRRYNARRKGRGVHPMIAHRREVGIERGCLGRCRRLAMQHRERIGGMTAR